MSKFHIAAALNKPSIFIEDENDSNVNKGINSQQHFLGKTPLHLAAEHGELTSLNALLDNKMCKSTLKDFNGQTPVHSVIRSIEYAADCHNFQKIDNLIEVLKVFSRKKQSDFNEKVGDTNITVYNLRRMCKVKKVQELFRGFDMILGAIKEHEEFDPQDFNSLLCDSPYKQQCQLEEAIFSLLENWAFNPHFEIEEHRGYLQNCIFNLNMFDSSENFNQMRNIAKLKMDVIHKDMFQIRDSMAETSEGGKKVIDNNEVPSITSDGPQMRIK
eukprot:9400358-Ditylum_brightwellii.AAC.1